MDNQLEAQVEEARQVAAPQGARAQQRVALVDRPLAARRPPESAAAFPERLHPAVGCGR
jgi:hypothetical protein